MLRGEFNVGDGKSPSDGTTSNYDLIRFKCDYLKGVRYGDRRWYSCLAILKEKTLYLYYKSSINKIVRNGLILTSDVAIHLQGSSIEARSKYKNTGKPFLIITVPEDGTRFLIRRRLELRESEIYVELINFDTTLPKVDVDFRIDSKDIGVQDQQSSVSEMTGTDSELQDKENLPNIMEAKPKYSDKGCSNETQDQLAKRIQLLFNVTLKPTQKDSRHASL